MAIKTDTLIMAYDLAYECLNSPNRARVDQAQKFIDHIDSEHPDIYHRWLDSLPYPEPEPADPSDMRPRPF